jgi:dienelactone hydrolase
VRQAIPDTIEFRSHPSYLFFQALYLVPGELEHTTARTPSHLVIRRRWKCLALSTLSHHESLDRLQGSGGRAAERVQHAPMSVPTASVGSDYLGRRGLKTCAGSVTHEDAARDLIAATAWLKSQPGIDHSRITAIGWSYGARGVLAAIVGNTQSQLPFFRAVVHYPDCRGLQPWKAAVPILMLLGGDDDMTPAALCQEVAKNVAAPAIVKIVVYPGALHGFDVPELPAKKRYGFATIGYHPYAAAAARKEMEQFLKPSSTR